MSAAAVPAGRVARLNFKKVRIATVLLLKTRKSPLVPKFVVVLFDVLSVYASCKSSASTARALGIAHKTARTAIG
jgi:hypothetical protein